MYVYSAGCSYSIRKAYTYYIATVRRRLDWYSTDAQQHPDVRPIQVLYSLLYSSE